MESIKPQFLCLGNFISAFGEVVMVKGVTPREDGTFYVHHTGMKSEGNPFGEGIEFDPMPLILTSEWKSALKIDKFKLPEHIKYVHEAQNYMLWTLQVNLLELIDFSELPKRQEFDNESKD